MRIITGKEILAVSASLVLLFGSTLANADPMIHGEISMAGGGATPVGGSGLADATGVEFTVPGFVTGGTEHFAGVTFGTWVTFSDFTFDPSIGVDPLWTFDFGGVTYSFEALSFNVDTQTANTLGLTGSGVLSATGFTDTMGGWSFSMDQPTGGTIFAWSSVTIPEPATMALFGVGLMGLGLSRRRSRKLALI